MASYIIINLYLISFNSLQTNFVSYLSIVNNYHFISFSDFWSSISAFLILDLMNAADADKSEFCVDPGITIPIPIPLVEASHFSNTLENKSFQILLAVNTKLCFVMSRLTWGRTKRFLLICLLFVNISLIEIGDLNFRILKISKKVKYLYKFLKLRKLFLLKIGFVCSS